MKKNLIYIISFLTVFLLSSCASVFGTDLIRSNYVAADTLILKSELQHNTTVVIATIVNINNLEKSSPLGRTISEQLTTRFVDAGIKVVEMKLRNDIYIKNETGELILSRKISNLAKKIKADAIVAGTYSDTPDTVFINLRIINPKTNIIKTTIDYSLTKDDNIEELLGNKRAGGFRY